MAQKFFVVFGLVTLILLPVVRADYDYDDEEEDGFRVEVVSPQGLRTLSRSDEEGGDDSGIRTTCTILNISAFVYWLYVEYDSSGDAYYFDNYRAFWDVSIHDMQPYGDTIYHKAAIYSIAAYASTFDDWNVPHEQLEMLPVGQNTEIACTYFAAASDIESFDDAVYDGGSYYNHINYVVFFDGEGSSSATSVSKLGGLLNYLGLIMAIATMLF